MCVFLLYCLFFYCFKANKECQKALKEIAETDKEIAKAVAEDLERETEEYIRSRASIAIQRDEPHSFILSAFDFETSIKGLKYWSEMTYKFCLNHPMVGTEKVSEDEAVACDEGAIKCNKCGSTNVSVGGFGDRTGVTCRDCGESRLLVD